MGFDASIVNDPRFKEESESEQAKILKDLVPSDAKGTQSAIDAVMRNPPKTFSTPSQVSMEEPSGLSKGLETLKSGFTEGMSKFTNPQSGLDPFTGLARMAAAPGEAVGESAGTAMQNILGSVPGLGGPSGIIPSAGAAITNTAGQVATGAVLPAVLSKAASIASAPVRSIIRAFDPFAKEKAIGQFAEKYLGLSSDPGQRIVDMGKLANNLYKVAEATGTPVSTAETTPIIDALEGNLRNTGREKIADDLLKKLNIPPQNVENRYSEVFRWVQEFRSKADSLVGSDNAAAAQLRTGAEALLTKLDNVSPVVREANARYALDQSAKTVLDALRGKDPGLKIKTALESDPSFTRSLNLRTPDKVNKFIDDITTIGKMRNEYEKARLLAKVAGGVFLAGAADLFMRSYVWHLAGRVGGK